MFNYFGTSSSGIGALGINGQAFLIQLITFLIVFLVLRRYAFKPILRVMRNRRELIESGVQLGEDMKLKSAQTDQEIAEELAKARAKADKIIIDADESAKESIRSAEETAKKRAEAIIKEADEQIEQDTQTARSRLEKELVGLISEATEAIIDEKIDPQKDAALIDKAIKGAKA